MKQLKSRTGLIMIVLSAVLAFGLAACGTSDGGENDGGVAAADISGIEWFLTAYGPADNPITPLSGTTISLQFEEAEVRGTAGCNTFFGSYTLADGVLSLEPLAITEMACLDPGIMQQEMTFVSALATAQSVALEGETMRLTYDGGVMVFEQVPPQPAASLTGQVWLLTAFEAGDTAASLVRDSHITAVFEADRLSGYGGCNRYGGTYALDGETLRITEIEQTLVDCPDEGLVDQEATYVAALEAAETYAIEGERLAVHYPGGTLRFRAMSPLSEAPFATTRWQLTAFGSSDDLQPLEEGTTITATFAEGKIGGTAGCNQYSASFTVQGDTLSLGPIAATERACEPPISEQESAYLGSLQEAAYIVVVLDGGQLTLITDSGRLVFE